MEKISEIVKLFQPREVKKSGSGRRARPSDEEYKQTAKRKGIRLPSKGW